MPASTKNYTDVRPFPDQITLSPIGIARTPWVERHGTPRQAALSERDEPISRLELFPEVIPPEALSDLEDFDYLWVLAWMHLNQHWNPTVMPPRGPRVRRGTLSTRSPHRPNPISLSAARLMGVEGNVITVSGLDLLDGTPILDVKPYVPYCDAWPDAAAGWVDTFTSGPRSGGSRL